MDYLEVYVGNLYLALGIIKNLQFLTDITFYVFISPLEGEI
jgi:hypothetical protein